MNSYYYYMIVFLHDYMICVHICVLVFQYHTIVHSLFALN